MSKLVKKIIYGFFIPLTLFQLNAIDDTELENSNENLVNRLCAVKKLNWRRNNKKIIYYSAEIVINEKKIAKLILKQKQGYLKFFNRKSHETKGLIKLPDDSTQRYLNAVHYYLQRKKIKKA